MPARIGGTAKTINFGKRKESKFKALLSFFRHVNIASTMLVNLYDLRFTIADLRVIFEEKYLCIIADRVADGDEADILHIFI